MRRSCGCSVPNGAMRLRLESMREGAREEVLLLNHPSLLCLYDKRVSTINK